MRVNTDGNVELDYLVYKGNREQGQITIGIMRGSSPHRYFHYRRGGRYEVGREVVSMVKDWLLKYHKDKFELVTEQVEGSDAFVVAFANLLAVYGPALKLRNFEDFIPLLEKGFAKEGSKLKIRRVIPRKELVKKEKKAAVKKEKKAAEKKEGKAAEKREKS